MTARSTGYVPMTLAHLAELLSTADGMLRWRYIAEFLEEYRWEPWESRMALLITEPSTTGDERWDAFVAALAEHLSLREGRAAPDWVGFRPLRQFWFPFDSAAAKTDALVRAPVSFRRRGVFVAPEELDVA